MIEAGADLNIQNNDGWTVLMLASRYSNEYSSENIVKNTFKKSIVKKLIEAGAYLNIQNNGGLTALMLASRYSNSKSSENVVKRLIDAGADIKLKDNNGDTAFNHIKIYKNDEKECCICLDNDIDYVFNPCGHCISCYDCSIKLKICPICRSDIKSILDYKYFQ